MKNYYEYINSKSQYFPIDLKKLNKELGDVEIYKKVVSFLFVERETVKFRRDMKGYLNTAWTPPMTQITSDRPADETLHLPTEAIVNQDEINVTLRKKDETESFKILWYVIDINHPVEIKADKKAIDEINKYINQVRSTKQFDL